MKTIQLFGDIVFHDANPNAEPLHVDQDGRVLRFALRPGQVVQEHSAPHSPVNIIVLKGHGMFAGGDQHEHHLGPNTMLVIDAGEAHSIRALDEELVFVAILHGVPTP